MEDFIGRNQGALTEAGVDEETAKRAAADEAVITAILEGGDAVLDLVLLGGGKALKAVLGEGAKAAGSQAAQSGVKKLGKALARYGLNIVSEGAQEWTEEGLSIANRRRAGAGDGTGVLDLTGRTAGVAWDALTGQDPESLAQMNEAGTLGMKIAAMVGGGQMLGNYGIRQAAGVRDARANQRIDRAIDGAYQTMQESGPFSEEARRSREQAAKAGAQAKAQGGPSWAGWVLPETEDLGGVAEASKRDTRQAKEAMARADRRLVLPTWAEIQRIDPRRTQNVEPEQQKTASTGETAPYRAVRPQNVEMPVVPIINLSMADVAALNQGVLPDSGGYLRKTAIQRARARLGLNENSAAYIPASNVLRNGEEYVLKITKASLAKMFSPSDGSKVSAETVAVMENLERIVNNGVYFRSEGDRKGRDSIQGVDHLMTTVYIDGQPYVVDMRVRIVQRKAGNQAADNVLYYLTPEEITAVKEDGGTSAAGRHVSDGEAPPSSNITLPRKQGDVNVQGTQMESGLVLPTWTENQQHIANQQTDIRLLRGGEMTGQEANQEGDLMDRFRRAAKQSILGVKVIGFDGLEEDYKNDFRDGLAKAAPAAKAVLRKLYRDMDYIIGSDDGSYYSQGKHKNTITLGSRASASTLAHELFHKLDEGHVISSVLAPALAQDIETLNSVSGGDVKSYLMAKYPTGV